MAKVSRRGGFSDRNGIKPENTEIQLKEIDNRTRIQIQNFLSQLNRIIYGIDCFSYDKEQAFFRFVLGEIYSEPIDASNSYNGEIVWKQINETIQHGEYDDVLTIVEAIIQYWDSRLGEENEWKRYNEEIGFTDYTDLYQCFNELFEREYLGYRFVDGVIIPISDPIEIKTINQTLTSKFEAVKIHISKANTLIADRTNPDYENSIKESISAVEVICEILLGVKGKDATLGKMLKKLEDNGISIHPGLKTAFIALYGYTSDAKGIRHSGDVEGASSTFEEAKFMLVSCCAFVNYLISVSKN